MKCQYFCAAEQSYGMPPLHKARERKDGECLAKQIKEDADPGQVPGGRPQQVGAAPVFGTRFHPVPRRGHGTCGSP